MLAVCSWLNRRVQCCTVEATLQADASSPQDDRVAPTVIKMLPLPARGRRCRASDVHLLHLAARICPRAVMQPVEISLSRYQPVCSTLQGCGTDAGMKAATEVCNSSILACQGRLTA